jgi:hypothetical protein
MLSTAHIGLVITNLLHPLKESQDGTLEELGMKLLSFNWLAAFRVGA